jgi:hypothetical protein
MLNIDPTLARAAQENPQELFRVIVRVEGDLDARQGQLEECGFSITRRSRLIHGFGAHAQGKAVLRLTEVDWVLSIERDIEMRTMQE